MASDVVVPEVGELSMDVTLARWLKSPGDVVAVGDVLFELDTDKTVVEVEAWTAGTLVDVRAAPGDVVTPRQVIARILAPSEASQETGAVPRLPVPDRGAPTGAIPSSMTSAAAAPASTLRDAARASPRAKRLAREHGVDLASLAGSGPDGLITERDVLDVAARSTSGEQG